MDYPSRGIAAGLRFVFVDVSIAGSPPGEGVPANAEVMVAGPPAFTRS